MIQTSQIIRGAVLTLAVSLSITVAAQNSETESAAASDGYRKGKAGAGTLPLDFWLPREALTPAQQKASPPYCAGAYLWPDFPVLSEAANNEQPVYAEARNAQYWDSGAVMLEGDVVVTETIRVVAAGKHQGRAGDLGQVRPLVHGGQHRRGHRAGCCDPRTVGGPHRAARHFLWHVEQVIETLPWRAPLSGAVQLQAGERGAP